MRLQVTHETAYDYAPAVQMAQHIVHLKPIETACQHLLQHQLTVLPEPAQVHESRDVWGNTRHHFSLVVRHGALHVVAQSLVQTAATAAPHSAMPWEAARERMRYHRQAAWDPASEFAFASPYVWRHADFTTYAMPSFTAQRPLLEAARDLTARIHRDFEYRPQATDVGTPALQVLASRQGVCQDFAHIMLGCLRSLGLPARYVSGYLLTQPPPGQPRLVGSDASHAWVSVYLPADLPGQPGVWVDLDPTNNRSAGEDYVTLAVGRDYGDVSPVRGVIQGGASHRLRVAVTVTPAPTIEP